MIKFVFKIFLVSVLLLKFSLVQAKLFNAEEFVLDNGMRVVVIPNHKAPIIKHMVWYQVGSVDEKLGQGGVAHLLEHLMFRGTAKIPGTELNKIMENNGMDANAFTGQDYTAYHQSMDISRLELAMFMEADRMQNLRLDDADFRLERDIVYQERKQVIENSPSSKFRESFKRLMWQEHPYALPVTGMPDEIMGLKRKNVVDFYHKYYAPNNAILVLAGDIDGKTAKVLAQKYYGGIEKSEVSGKARFPVLDNDFQAKLEMALPKISSPRMMNSWLAPSVNVEPEEVYNLIVLAKYLGDGKTSKLYKKLVADKKLALGIDASYDYLTRSYGSFVISALPADGVSVEILQKEIDQAVTEAVAEINLDEIENTKQKLLSGLVYLNDNPNDAAYIVGSMLSVGMKLSDVEEHADRIKAVDYKDVIKSAKKLLKQKARVKGVLMPQEVDNHD